MKTDINGRVELELLVDRFYEKVRSDELLAPLFAHVNWDRHLPVMYSFWENTIFYTGGYYGNPLKTHQTFHHRHPMNQQHFERWLSLFVATVDDLFEGEKANLAKQRAMSISTVMQLKILH